MKVQIEAADALQLARLIDWFIDDHSSYYYNRAPSGTKAFARQFRKRLDEALKEPAT